MKKLVFIIAIIVLGLMFTDCEKDFVEDPANDLGLKSSKNDKLTGFDEWGFNWNAHQFNGYLINMMLGDHYFEGWAHYQQHVYDGEGIEFWNMLQATYGYFHFLMPVELLDAKLNAHWNNGLISKNGVYPATWLNSDAWISFKYSGNDGNEHWSHFRKLVATKTGDYLDKQDTNGDGIVDMNDDLGTWYNADGEEIGFESAYWPELIVVQVINTGNVPPFFYAEYVSPWGPGYGHYKSN
jgi:predicted DNA-binding protein (MmcQ/YjbR family)